MNKPSPSLESFMQKEFNRAPMELKEAKKPRYSYSAYAEMVAKAAMNKDKSYSNKLLNKAQQQWSILENLLNVADDGIYPTKISAGPEDYAIKDIKNGANYIIKLMINFTAYEHLTKMLASSKGEIKNVTKVLKKIFSIGCRNLLVEGGKNLTDSFLKNKLFNEFYLFKSSNKLGSIGKLNVATQLHQLPFKYKNKSNINSFTGYEFK